MQADERVPMQPTAASIFGPDSVEFSATSDHLRAGKRFSMVVDEAVLRKVPQAALTHAVEEIGKIVAHRHTHDVSVAVTDLLYGKEHRDWFHAIVEDQLRRSVHGCAVDIMLSSVAGGESSMTATDFPYTETGGGEG